ncbi:MAG: DUF4942 domain-containing protein [Idiomarina sp.]|nr:DUF4942 domain-containing protein [Idiomarina sp.]
MLHAWDILHDGEIVAILNAETIRNPFSRERKHLARLVEQHGHVEYIKDAFAGPDADRKTGVEVALVYLRKEAGHSIDIVGDILKDMKRDAADAEALAEEYEDSKAVILPESFIENTVLTFNAAVEAGKQMIFSQSRFNTYQSNLGLTMAEANNAEADARVGTDRTYVLRELNTLYADLKDRAWTTILRSTNVTNRLSQDAQRRLESEFQTIKAMEFTTENIYGFLCGLVDKQGDIQIEMACDVFDMITRFHTDNAAYYMGWKSNDKHRTCGIRIKMSRFILPYFTNEGWRRSLDWNQLRTLSDFDKVFAMLDGKLAPEVSLREVFETHYDDLVAGERISTSYFDVRYYPGVGTIHFFPRDKALIERLNRLVGRHRKWLPPQDARVPEAFWLQFEKAERHTKDFIKEVSAREPSRFGCSLRTARYGTQDERTKADAVMVEAMAETLYKHGIEPDSLPPAGAHAPLLGLIA